jgi:hypothetical protein
MAAPLVTAGTLRDWTRTHTEHVGGDCWGPPPAAAGALVHRLVELVCRAHERGRVLPGLGPDTVGVSAAGRLWTALPERPGPPAERAVDLLALGRLLALLATGTDLARCPDTDPAVAMARLSEGNPVAAALTPLVLALLHPDPDDPLPPAALRMLLTGRPPATGTTTARLAGG